MAQTLTALDGDRRARHQSFLLHNGQLYMRVAVGLCLLSIVAYLAFNPSPRHSGGDWLGYTLGTVGALLIVWLTLLGLRKRAITPGRWSLKAWTSAHVYLGLSLIVIGTLHTGFQFGWNVHTLAYALMLVVIGSGMFGIYYYATLPRLMSDNRAETGGAQMLEEIAALDVDLAHAAQPIGEADAKWVQRSIEAKNFSRALHVRLARRHPRCPTARALQALRTSAHAQTGGTRDSLGRVIALLERKEALLGRARRHIRYKTLLELWLYVHVPITFALLAALTVHIISVFYFW
jgi:hypothetical protein